MNIVERKGDIPDPGFDRLVSRGGETEAKKRDRPGSDDPERCGR